MGRSIRVCRHSTMEPFDFNLVQMAQSVTGADAGDRVDFEPVSGASSQGGKQSGSGPTVVGRPGLNFCARITILV